MIGWFGLDYQSLTTLWSVTQVFVSAEKMTFLDFPDMYVDMFVVISTLQLK